HRLSLEVDGYGKVLKSASILYGRKNPMAALPPEVSADQQRLYITYGEIDYTADFDQTNPSTVYRLRVPFESRIYEITGVKPASEVFQLVELKNKIAGTAEIPYEQIANEAIPQRRLLSDTRRVFMDNALNPLPFGHW